MEARPWKNGKTVTYRYHPIGSAPVNLGTDKTEAVRRVALMIGQVTHEGTIGTLWEHYKASPDWTALSERSLSPTAVIEPPMFGVMEPATGG
jgi:hypothetical protein